MEKGGDDGEEAKRCTVWVPEAGVGAFSEEEEEEDAVAG